MNEHTDGELIPPAFKNQMHLYVSQELLADSQMPELHEFLADPQAYRLKHPWTPPTRKQRIKTWIGVRREKIGARLYKFAVGRHPREDFGDDY